MYLSTRGRYATRAMLELALHYGEAPRSTAAIGRGQGISERYLQQLLGTLKRAGLVRVVMGPGGGYTLAAPPPVFRHRLLRVAQLRDPPRGHTARLRRGAGTRRLDRRFPVPAPESRTHLDRCGGVFPDPPRLGRD